MRQKAYISELEKQLNTLSTENADYKSKVDLLRTENKFIKDQLAFLHNFISHAISLSFPSTNSAPQVDNHSTQQQLPNAPNLMNMMSDLANMLNNSNNGNMNPASLMQMLAQFSNTNQNTPNSTSGTEAQEESPENEENDSANEETSDQL